MVTEVVIPMLGVTVENGKIIEWLKQEGDPVQKGESIFVVEADKVTTEVESPATGILAKILLSVGQTVAVLSVVAVITERGEEVPEKYRQPGVVEGGLPGEPAVSSGSAVAAPVLSTETRGPVRIVPAARKMAREVGIPLEELAGTGPGGIICLKDVEVAAASGQKPGPRASTLAGRAARSHSIGLEGIEGTGVRGRIMQKDVEAAAARELAPGLGKRIPMSSMRQAIARRMTQSAFSAPHIYFFTDIAMDDLLAFRAELLPEIEKRAGVRLSVNDLLIKAVALNILDFPLLNAVVGEAEIHIQPDVNVGLAVALPDGLIVPAVPMADGAGLAEIARLRKDLVERARRGKLKQEEMERGTFTISSLAQSEITQFTAILNPPQSGILSVGKLREELYLHHGEVRSRRITSFGLSADHRIIDGQMAADFLKRLKAKLERPHVSFAHI